MAAPTTAAVPPGDDGITTVATAAAPGAEAWYRPESPTCATPAGCPPVSPPSAYPDGTLHVGVVAGQEESRTYLSFAMPAPGTLRGGTLQLPVGPTADGTLQAASAKLQACLVSGVVRDKVAGDIGDRPSADCSVTSPAVARSVGGAILLTVDLAPFVPSWGEEATGSLALLPAEGVAPSDVWHVAFSRHDRSGGGSAPLSATLLVASSNDVASPPVERPISEPGVPVPPAAVATLPQVGSVTPVPAPDVPGAPEVAPPADAASAAQRVDSSFAYPGVFLLPPLVLLAAGWCARAFTRDLAGGGP